MWSDAAITNSGRAILERWIGGGVLELDYCMCGSGTVAPAALMSQTGVTQPMGRLPITEAQRTEQGARIKTQITAGEVGYTARQIGLFAHLDTEAPVLLAIFQDATGVEIPSSADMPDFVFSFFGTVQISNSGQFSAVLDPGALVSASTLRDYAPVYKEASENAALISGEKLTVALGKIARAITSLIAHLASKANPHKVTRQQIGLENAENTKDAEKKVFSASKLAAARSLSVNLSSESVASFDGTQNAELGVKGTLPIAKGGTGAATAANALNALGGMPKSGGTFAGNVNFNEGNTSKKRVMVDKGDGVSATMSTGAEPKMASVYLSVGGQWTNALTLYEDKSTLTKPLDVASGGTGAKTAEQARKNLGITSSPILELANGTISATGAEQTVSFGRTLQKNPIIFCSQYGGTPCAYKVTTISTSGFHFTAPGKGTDWRYIALVID